MRRLSQQDDVTSSRHFKGSRNFTQEDISPLGVTSFGRQSLHNKKAFTTRGNSDKLSSVYRTSLQFFRIASSEGFSATKHWSKLSPSVCRLPETKRRHFFRVQKSI